MKTIVSTPSLWQRVTAFLKPTITPDTRLEDATRARDEAISALIAITAPEGAKGAV